jgi:hypothetical protein
VVANADQRDSDNDGFGNICDGDLNQDNIVNGADLGILFSVFFTADANADLNGDTGVNGADLGSHFSRCSQPPAPAALAP